MPMSVELDEVRDFLAQHEPYSHLPAEELDRLPGLMEMRYARRGETVIARGAVNDHLFVIRSGAVDVVGEQDLLLDRREPGLTFGYSTMVGEPASRYQMVAVEDTLLLVIPRAVFEELSAAHPDVRRYFSSQSARLAHAAAQMRGDPSQDVLATPVAAMVAGRQPVMIEQTASIREAAAEMAAHNVSSILLTCGGELTGILTDKDLRGRVVARALDVTSQVTAVMTPSPVTIASTALAFEAMLLMTERGFHHLPVVDGTGVVGVVTSGDLSRLLKANPMFITGDLSRRRRDELQGAYHRAAETTIRLIDRGVGAHEAAQLLTTAADALVRRLIALFEKENGPAPVEYAFVAVGSQGRREMGPASDQDNALVLADSYNPAEHGTYFEGLSTFVCTGLDEAGQTICPGDMMAMNPRWRMTVSEWQDTFHRWITAPQPDALLHAQIYFDMRAVAGAEDLATRVHESAVAMAAGATRLHAHLAALAARRDPPLGFFRGLVVERGGEYAKTLDVKKGGTAGLVQMARLYALKAGVTAVGTRDRLEQTAGASISESAAVNLRDAFDYLTALTLRHQAEQLRRGENPDYHIDPGKLSTIYRENLRDAFQIIKKMQTALANAHPVRNI